MYERSLPEGFRFRLVRLLKKKPSLSQRGVAHNIGVGRPKSNAGSRVLLENGHVKAVNFRNSRNRAGYVYPDFDTFWAHFGVWSSSGAG